MKFNASKEPKEKTKPEFHYAIIPDELDDDERTGEVKPEELRTWCKIYRYCMNKKSLHPSLIRDSLKEISELIGVEKRTLQRHVPNLEERGWLETKCKRNKSYRITLNKKRDKSEDSKG